MKHTIALFALLLGTAVYVALFLPEEVARLRGDYAAALPRLEQALANPPKMDMALLEMAKVMAR